jgi:hypothetical protein
MIPVLTTAAAVAAEVERRLRLCTVAQGAETDLGAAFFAGRRTIDVSDYPCCILIEGADTPRDQTRQSGNVVIGQRYVLAGFVACDADRPNDAAHAVLRDLKRAMFSTNGKPDSRFDGGVHDVLYKARDIQPRVDGQNYVAALIEIEVTYPEKLSSP